MKCKTCNKELSQSLYNITKKQYCNRFCENKDINVSKYPHDNNIDILKNIFRMK